MELKRILKCIILIPRLTINECGIKSRIFVKTKADDILKPSLLTINEDLKMHPMQSVATKVLFSQHS